MAGNSGEVVNALLIVKDKSKFRSHVNFLGRRGWGVAAISSLREAIEHLVTKRPNFVLISVNHPNPKLPKMAPFFFKTSQIDRTFIYNQLKLHLQPFCACTK